MVSAKCCSRQEQRERDGRLGDGVALEFLRLRLLPTLDRQYQLERYPLTFWGHRISERDVSSSLCILAPAPLALLHRGTPSSHLTSTIVEDPKLVGMDRPLRP